MASLVQLAIVPELEVPCPFAATTATALRHWQARPGMIVTVVDAQGGMWRARLLELHRDGGVLLPFYRSSRALESPLRLTVYQALPAKERFELILEKLTELGVTRIVPFVSQHSATLATHDEKQQKSHRWPDLLRRAAIQCRRALIPELGPCLALNEVYAAAQDAELRLMLYEGEGTTPLRDLLAGEDFTAVALLVGPEGGFAPAEVAAARAHDFHPISLGPRILRTETAAISAATIIQFALGDLR